MEQPNTIPVMAKRVLNIVRVLYYMIRKGISNRKLLVELKMMMKRGKIAGKAIHNLMFHHHHHHHNHHSGHPSSGAGGLSVFGPREYEFSCSNSPSFPFHLMRRNNKAHNSSSHFFPCAHAPATEDDDRVLTADSVRRVLEMMERAEAAENNGSPGSAMVSAWATPMSGFWQSPAARDLIYSELSSPALPGFGRTPMARQLRITDSPYPLRDGEYTGDCHVDEAAEEFISRFYKELQKQNKMGTLQR